MFRSRCRPPVIALRTCSSGLPSLLLKKDLFARLARLLKRDDLTSVRHTVDPGTFHIWNSHRCKASDSAQVTDARMIQSPNRATTRKPSMIAIAWTRKTKRQVMCKFDLTLPDYPTRPRRRSLVTDVPIAVRPGVSGRGSQPNCWQDQETRAVHSKIRARSLRDSCPDPLDTTIRIRHSWKCHAECRSSPRLLSHLARMPALCRRPRRNLSHRHCLSLPPEQTESGRQAMILAVYRLTFWASPYEDEFSSVVTLSEEPSEMSWLEDETASSSSRVTRSSPKASLSSLRNRRASRVTPSHS